MVNISKLLRRLRRRTIERRLRRCERLLKVYGNKSYYDLERDMIRFELLLIYAHFVVMRKELREERQSSKVKQ